ncbi:hypothetical protein NHJ6243_002510 [Beauveria neobassiana]
MQPSSGSSRLDLPPNSARLVADAAAAAAATALESQPEEEEAAAAAAALPSPLEEVY